MRVMRGALWCACLVLGLGCSSREAEPPSVDPTSSPTPAQAEAPPVAGLELEDYESTPGPSAAGLRFRNLAARERRDLGLPREAPGILVQEVVPRGPAAGARLAPGDVIQALDGAPVASSCGFAAALARRATGETVTLAVQRRNATFQAVLTLVDAIDLYTVSCDVGEAAGCLLLSEQEHQDAAHAQELAEKSCRLGLADGCSMAGMAYLQGTEMGVNERRSLELFERACLLGSASGCASEAFQYATGRGVPRDDARATQRYERSCDGGNPLGCYNLGLMLADGRGVRKDEARSLDAYADACDGGSSLACTNLGYHYEHGLGTPANDARAAELYRRACDGNPCEQGGDPKGCYNLAIFYRHGEGVAQDKAKAAELFARVCAGGDVNACTRLGLMRETGEGIAKDAEGALQAYGRACELGEKPACADARRLGKK
jgi:TPR repeat protein